MDETLRSAVVNQRIPAVVGMVGNASELLYAGSFGQRDSLGPSVSSESIFQIASMTKAITSVAALQLVEQGKLRLDEPVAERLPELSKIDVLEGFDAKGDPILRPMKGQITLRHLLTHTSGFCYGFLDQAMSRYRTLQQAGLTGGSIPVRFEPGTRWQYGHGLVWVGRLIEALSGTSLENYFQRNIFKPLEMQTTSYLLDETKFDRLVSVRRRAADGALMEDERKLPLAPRAFQGGGGLFSTAGDYLRFLQMILGYGKGPGNVRILQAKTVENMISNQTGDLKVEGLKSLVPELSSDVDLLPATGKKWGLGFLINTAAVKDGRSAASLTWGGMYNTFFWIDPKQQICAVLMMQLLPFMDREAVRLLNEFERSVYADCVK